MSDSKNDEIERCEWRCLPKAEQAQRQIISWSALLKLVLLVSCSITSIAVCRGGFFSSWFLLNGRVPLFFFPRPNYSVPTQVLIGRSPGSDDAQLPRRRRLESFSSASLHSISFPFVFGIAFCFWTGASGGLRRHRSIQAGTQPTGLWIPPVFMHSSSRAFRIFTNRNRKVKGRQLRGAFVRVCVCEFVHMRTKTIQTRAADQTKTKAKTDKAKISNKNIMHTWNKMIMGGTAWINDLYEDFKRRFGAPEFLGEAGEILSARFSFVLWGNNQQLPAWGILLFFSYFLFFFSVVRAVLVFIPALECAAL